jgi:proline iminopeptidase
MRGMTEIAALPGGRTASYTIIGNGRLALMFAGGPGFTAAYMRGDAELLSDVLCSHLIDPHGSGSSTPPDDPASYSPEGHARFYEEVRQALGLPPLVVLGHSFGATTALTYAALFPESTTACIAVAGFGIGPEADAGQGGAAEAEFEALMQRHADAPWYAEARPVMDEWTERMLAATDPAEMESMMATVLPFYAAEPGRPEVAAGLAKFSQEMRADLAAGKAWEGGLFQSVDLRPLASQITSPTLIVAGELDFLCGPAQARPLAEAITGARLELIPGCGHFPSIEAPGDYRHAIMDFVGLPERAGHDDTPNRAPAGRAAGSPSTSPPVSPCAPDPAGGVRNSGVTLNVSGCAAGISPADFAKIARDARDNCPASKALTGPGISLVVSPG